MATTLSLSHNLLTLPKYHGLKSEDAYFFIREFEEVSHDKDTIIRGRFC